MNSSVLLATVAVLLFSSCSAGKYAVHPFYKGLPDEQQIVSIVFDELLGLHHCGGELTDEAQTKYHFRERFRDRDVMARVLDSLKSLPDSVRCIVYVGDATIGTCCFGCPGDTGKRSIPALDVDRVFVGVDASWYPLICRWQAPSRVPRPFDVSWVHTRYRYDIRNEGSERAREHIFDPVTMHFSMIAFDDDARRACIYTRMKCGGLCGSEDMWFLRKTGAGWKLDERKNLSVS
jgi:hypothetical protein